MKLIGTEADGVGVVRDVQSAPRGHQSEVTVVGDEIFELIKQVADAIVRLEVVAVHDGG